MGRREHPSTPSLSHPVPILGDMTNGPGTPTLFDDIDADPADGISVESGHDAAHARLQLRIRELNADRLSRQDDDQRLGRRRAAVARLRRRLAESDEVEAGYWNQRRSELQLVRS